MGNLNKVLLIGRLGKDPEKRVTQQGASVVTLTMATSEKFKDRTGNMQEKTEWHKIVFWNKQAEVLEQYCRKGSELYIEGSLQTREWQDKDGNKRWSTEIAGRNFQFLGAAGQGQGQGQGYQANQGGAQQGGYQQPQGGLQDQGGFQQPQGGFQQPQSGFQQPQGGFQQPQGGSQPTGNTPPPQDDFIEDDIPF
ncbi:MAG: single-stranded DNA-binding protein [SAR324 cluster bacterium]|uniref:Single-stranded DNA-binding protein n=1 Tax=SAR324 cluster bacterium TaxID=2024889 RepID=A0A2A4T4F8_9DELT|nr:MAG: single-stranded DNA-binding protein [SAR324 cluster bacterium]